MSVGLKNTSSLERHAALPEKRAEWDEMVADFAFPLRGI